jgi:hypothetical protein
MSSLARAAGGGGSADGYSGSNAGQPVDALTLAREATAAQTARDTAGFGATTARDAAGAGYATSAASAKTQAERDAQLRDEAFQTSTAATAQSNAQANQARMLAMIPGLMASITGPAVAAPSEVDTKAAEDAAFARAKDRTADLARSSLMTLRGAASEAGRNVSGGTNPALQASEGQLLAKANQPLADLTRQQAIDSTTRAQSVSDRNYAGNIALQGQKTALAPSMLSLLKVGGLY